MNTTTLIVLIMVFLKLPHLYAQQKSPYANLKELQRTEYFYDNDSLVDRQVTTEIYNPKGLLTSRIQFIKNDTARYTKMAYNETGLLLTEVDIQIDYNKFSIDDFSEFKKERRLFKKEFEYNNKGYPIKYAEQYIVERDGKSDPYWSGPGSTYTTSYTYTKEDSIASMITRNVKDKSLYKQINNIFGPHGKIRQVQLHKNASGKNDSLVKYWKYDKNGRIIELIERNYYASDKFTETIKSEYQYDTNVQLKKLIKTSGQKYLVKTIEYYTAGEQDSVAVYENNEIHSLKRNVKPKNYTALNNEIFYRFTENWITNLETKKDANGFIVFAYAVFDGFPELTTCDFKDGLPSKAARYRVWINDYQLGKTKPFEVQEIKTSFY